MILVKILSHNSGGRFSTTAPHVVCYAFSDTDPTNVTVTVELVVHPEGGQQGSATFKTAQPVPFTGPFFSCDFPGVPNDRHLTLIATAEDSADFDTDVCDDLTSGAWEFERTLNRLFDSLKKQEK